MRLEREVSALKHLAFGVMALWAWPVLAHGPMDHSARIVLMGDGLELAVTLGPDLAQQALAHGGITSEQVKQLLASHGPSGHGIVSSQSFAALAGLRGQDGDLVPTRAIVMTDGLEYLFVATYARPASGPLTFQAHYHEAVEGAKPGGVELVDEATGRRLAFKALDASQKSIELNLPPLKPEAATNSSSAIAVVQPAPLSLAETNVATTETKAAASGGDSWIWWLGGLVTAGAALLFWLRGRGRSA